VADPELIARARVAQAALDRFGGRPLAWGERDCAHLAKFVLMRLGHGNPLKGVKPYRGEVGAVRALHHAERTAGAPPGAGLAAILDAMGLQRIAPADALPCDLVGLAGPEPFGIALAVAVGNGKALAFAAAPQMGGEPRGMVGEMLALFRTPEGEESTVARMAWRVPPCLK